MHVAACKDHSRINELAPFGIFAGEDGVTTQCNQSTRQESILAILAHPLAILAHPLAIRAHPRVPTTLPGWTQIILGHRELFHTYQYDNNMNNNIFRYSIFIKIN